MADLFSGIDKKTLDHDKPIFEPANFYLEFLIEKRKPWIIVLTETWFKNNDDVNLHCVEGYQDLFISIRSERRGVVE